MYSVNKKNRRTLLHLTFLFLALVIPKTKNNCFVSMKTRTISTQEKGEAYSRFITLFFPSPQLFRVILPPTPRFCVLLSMYEKKLRYCFTIVT